MKQSTGHPSNGGGKLEPEGMARPCGSGTAPGPDGRRGARAWRAAAAVRRAGAPRLEVAAGPHAPTLSVRLLLFSPERPRVDGGQSHLQIIP